MCTLVPMRSVPHRVVCLLGLDDGFFPRHGPPDGDDILRLDPVVGDRDVRNEDRQLLLDALLAAEDRLIITYSGRDERTNAEQPPAVPVGELLDVSDRTARHRHPMMTVRDQLVVHHPLQPFDPRNFLPGGVGAAGVWSFDGDGLAGAVALSSLRSRSPARMAVRTPAEALLPPGELLPAESSRQVGLDELTQFVRHPVRAFLRQRLGVTAPGDWPSPGDDLAVEMDPLARWQIGNRLVELRLAGTDPANCRRAELARGALPPGELGAAILDEILPRAEGLVAAAGRGRSTAWEVAVHLGDRVVTGTVTDVFGDELRTVTYSQLAPSHRLSAWIRLVALTAESPERAWYARVVGRGPSGAPAVATLGPLGSEAAARQETAIGILGRLVELYDLGMRAALPLSCRASAAWAEARRKGRDPESAARAVWLTPGGSFDGEDRDPAHVLAFGAVVSFDSLLRPWTAPPGELPPGEVRAGEVRAGAERLKPRWAEKYPRDGELLRPPQSASHQSKATDSPNGGGFGWLACRLWDDVLDWERRS